MSAAKNININLKIWRQKNANSKGSMETYKLDNVSIASSFLEMLDQLNEQLINENIVRHKSEFSGSRAENIEDKRFLLLP